MIQLTLVDRLSSHSFQNPSQKLLAVRKLYPYEAALVRQHNIKRFYLPALTVEQQNYFLKEFDNFWDEVIDGFDETHRFWRNGIAAKMQEWERSFGVLLQTIFALTTVDSNKELQLLVVTNGRMENKIWENWARLKGWSIQSSSSRNDLMDKALNLVLYLKHVLYFIRQKIFSPSLSGLMPLNDSPVTLIISLLYPGKTHDGPYEDMFFSKIHEFLEKKGERCIYLVNPLGSLSRLDKKNIFNRRDKVQLIYSHVSWPAFFLILVRALFNRIHLSKANFMGCDMRVFLEHNAGSFMTPFNIQSEIYYYVVKEFSKKYKCHRMIYLFEGNSFEKACIQGFRETSGGKIDAYHHGVAIPMNLKLRLTPKESQFSPCPDRYICAGALSKQILKNLQKTDKAEFGDGCALRYVPTITSHDEGGSVEKNVLIALDGLWTSIHFLEWLIENKEALSAFKVLIRSHPNVPVKDMIERLIYDFPENFEISKESLENDLKRSFCVIYRHTSIGMQAILNNIPAIYVGAGLPLSGDPFFQPVYGKWDVLSCDDLKKALGEIFQIRKSKWSTESLQNTKDMIKGYFLTPTPSHLESFLSNESSYG